MIERMAPAWLLMLAATAVGGPAAAEGIVLSSTAPGMTVGRMIADDETLRLPEGSLTTLLLPTGQTLTLAGPYDGKPAPPQGGGGASGGLADWKGLDLSSLGGTRGERLSRMAIPDAAAPLSIDASTAGTWCVPSGTPLRLAAPKAAGTATLHLEDARTKATAVVSWPDGKDQPWPPQLPVADGTTILARPQGADAPHPIRFRATDDGAADDFSRVVSWSRAGCYRQAAPFLREIGAQVAPFELYLSTNRGRTPRYVIGETVTLVLQSNRSANLHCYLLRDASVSPLFLEPPGFVRLADHTELRIPGERVAIEIAALPPPGVGEVRCYAVDPAGGSKLAIPGDALNDPTGQRLDRLFGGLSEGRVARATLHIRID